MGKYSNQKKLSKKQQQELFIKFSQALSKIHNPVEAAQFLKDLLSEQEAIMLARRLQVAELLNDGFTYAQIIKLIKVSAPTIARVQTWLSLYGEGYRTIIKRTHKNNKNSKSIGSLSWSRLKHKYPMYFWPEILLKEIVKSASGREKKRLLDVINQMTEKTKLNKVLTFLLKPTKTNSVKT